MNVEKYRGYASLIAPEWGASRVVAGEAPKINMRPLQRPLLGGGQPVGEVGSGRWRKVDVGRDSTEGTPH